MTIVGMIILGVAALCLVGGIVCVVLMERQGRRHEAAVAHHRERSLALQKAGRAHQRRRAAARKGANS